MTTSQVTAGQMIEVNGANLYVEEHGEGAPVVLAHGGLMSSASWAGVVPALAGQFRVITFDTRGHGRSTNPAGKLGYEMIADDIAALCQTMKLDHPFIGGWSDGGEFALQIGTRHPGLARGLIAGGTSLELGTEKARADMRAFFNVGPDARVDFDAFAAGIGAMLLPMMRQAHPNGEAHWQGIVQQSADMWIGYAGLTTEQLQKIDAPVLVIAGDRDQFVPCEELTRLYRSLPTAELAILPGTDHFVPLTKPDSFARTITDFLGRN